MKIVVDCRYTRIGQHDGISRFTAGIVTELAKRHPLTMLVSDHRQLEMLPPLPWQLVSGADEHPRAARRAAGEVAAARHRVQRPCRRWASWGRNYRLLLDPPRPDLLREPHAAARPRAARPAALAAVPPRLVAAAPAAEPRRRGRHRLGDDRGLIHEHHLTDRPVTIVAERRRRPRPATLPRARPRAGDRALYMGSYMPYKNVETLVRGGRTGCPTIELHLLSRISDDERARLTRPGPQARLVFHDGVTDAEYAELLWRPRRALVTRLAGRGLRHPARRGDAPGHSRRRERHPDLPRDRGHRGQLRARD